MTAREAMRKPPPREVLAVAGALQPRTVYLKGLSGDSVTLYGSREEAIQFLAALDAAGWAVVPKPKRDQGEIVWKGKPASTLTREELMEALGIATDEMERQCDNYLHVRRLLTERGRGAP